MANLIDIALQKNLSDWAAKLTEQYGLGGLPSSGAPTAQGPGMGVSTGPKSYNATGRSTVEAADPTNPQTPEDAAPAAGEETPAAPKPIWRTPDQQKQLRKSIARGRLQKRAYG